MILEIIWRCMAKTLCKYLINSRNPKNSIMTTFSIFFLIFNVKFQISKKKHMPRGEKNRQHTNYVTRHIFTFFGEEFV